MDQNFYIKLLKNPKACMTPLHGDTVDELIKYWEERHEWKMAAEEYISDIIDIERIYSDS